MSLVNYLSSSSEPRSAKCNAHMSLWVKMAVRLRTGASSSEVTSDPRSGVRRMSRRGGNSPVVFWVAVFGADRVAVARASA